MCCLAGCSFTSLDGLAGGGGEEASEPDASQSVAPDAGPSDATTPTLDSGAADGAITDSSVADGGGHLPTPDPSLDASFDGGGGKTCSGGEILCNGACIDPTSDPSNCNGCGNVCATGRCGTTIAAPMTSLPAGWNFNGSASYDTSAPSAELTVANVPQQAGTFLYQNALGVDGMDVVFQFRIGLQGGLRDDGMGFVIEENGASAIGHLGSGLGMAGLTGFGVELDIFDNGDCGDTSDDHVGVDDLTICDVDNGTPTSLSELDVTSQLDLADTHWHAAEIALSSGEVTLSIDGTTMLSNVPLTGLDSNGTYYIGFAGGTGGLELPDGGGGYRQEVKGVLVTFATPRCL
jgi:Bacterial lectin